jgi:leucyl-tRNA synthetase
MRGEWRRWTCCNEWVRRCASLTQISASLLRLIAPIAPHLAEELHQHAGGVGSVFVQDWQSLHSHPAVDVSPLLQLRVALLADLAEAGIKSAADVDVAIELEYDGEHIDNTCIVKHPAHDI